MTNIDSNDIIDRVMARYPEIEKEIEETVKRKMLELKKIGENCGSDLDTEEN